MGRQLKINISNDNYIIPDQVITMSDNEELTVSVLNEMLGLHRKLTDLRYKKLKDAYIGAYPIWTRPKKPDYKPDNRLAINFAKYIVDTMNEVNPKS